MSVNPKKELIDEIGHDLRILGELISNHQLSVAGDRIVHSASGDLWQSVGGVDVLNIELANIELKIHSEQRFKPAGVELDDHLVANIILQQDLELASAGASLDSILQNAVSFEIKGEVTRGRTKREVISAWHFDRHSHESAPSSTCHPTYHWQFGGWGLKEISDQIDGVLIMDTPRLFAPPLDAVLAVDFLLAHFNGPRWQTVRTQEPRYAEIVRRSQARLWKPYFNELTAHIDNVGSSTSNHFGKLLPNII